MGSQEPMEPMPTEPLTYLSIYWGRICFLSGLHKASLSKMFFFDKQGNKWCIYLYCNIFYETPDYFHKPFNNIVNTDKKILYYSILASSFSLPLRRTCYRSILPVLYQDTSTKHELFKMNKSLFMFTVPAPIKDALE